MDRAKVNYNLINSYYSEITSVKEWALIMSERERPDIDKLLGGVDLDALGKALGVVRSVLAPPPKEASILQKWIEQNGGGLPSWRLPVKLLLNEGLTKEEQAERSKILSRYYAGDIKLPPALAGEPPPGYLLHRLSPAKSVSKNTFELVCDKPGLKMGVQIVDVPFEKDGKTGTKQVMRLSYGTQHFDQDIVEDHAVGEPTRVILYLKGVGPDTEVDLSNLKMPDNMNFRLAAETLQGVPKKIRMPADNEQRVSVVVTGLDIETQNAVAKRGGKPLHSTLELEVPISSLKDAKSVRIGPFPAFTFGKQEVLFTTAVYTHFEMGTGYKVNIVPAGPEGKYAPVPAASCEIKSTARNDGTMPVPPKIETKDPADWGNPKPLAPPPRPKDSLSR